MIPKIELSKDGRRQAIRYTISGWRTVNGVFEIGIWKIYDRYENIIIETFKDEIKAEKFLKKIHSKYGYYEKIK